MKNIEMNFLGIFLSTEESFIYSMKNDKYVFLFLMASSLWITCHI